MKNKNGRIEKPGFNRAGYQIDLKDLNGEPLPDPAKLDFKPFRHGGKRMGAGRKRSGRRPILLRLSPKLILALRKEAEQRHQTLSEVAERRLAQG